MVEKISSVSEFEHNRYREQERKYLPLFPEALEPFRSSARPIEQFYLSHPDEPFSLRFREIVGMDGELNYTAALKDRGQLTDVGLERLEVETDISSELYSFYKTDEAAVLHKLRYQAHPDIVVDYYEDGHVQVESEDDGAFQAFTSTQADAYVELTGDRIVDNEWRAHLAYRKRHGGQETLVPKPDISIDAAVKTLGFIAASRSTAVARICGRSGSGKSTVVRDLQRALENKGLESVVLSTDNYHRGATWLRSFNQGQEWTDWDDPVVYDTAAMKRDLEILLSGEPVERRSIDFTVCEPVVSGFIEPTPIVLIEGIYAGAKEFEFASQLRIDIPTPLATSIGRRLLRDIQERPEFADPGKSFRYMLEQAEPMWRRQNEDTI